MRELRDHLLVVSRRDRIMEMEMGVGMGVGMGIDLLLDLLLRMDRVVVGYHLLDLLLDRRLRRVDWGIVGRMGMGMGINHLLDPLLLMDQGTVARMEMDMDLLLRRMDRVIVDQVIAVRMETVHRDRRVDRVIMVLMVRMALALGVPVEGQMDRRMEDRVVDRAGISIRNQFERVVKSHGERE